MAIKKPICNYSGVKKELQPGDEPALTGTKASIVFTLNGGGQAITTALVANALRAGFGATVTGWEIDSVESGSIVFDVLKNGSSIVASAPPTLSSSTNANSTTLTGWTTSIAKADKITIAVSSASTVKHVTLTLYLART